MKLDDVFPYLGVPSDLACSFFFVFERYEYALKASGYLSGGKNEAKADWDSFAKAIDAEMWKIEAPHFAAAVEFLLTEPPRKQVEGQYGEVGWKDSPPDQNLTKAEQVMLMVRRVRNNLFHGGKSWVPDDSNRARNTKLVKAALAVLVDCMHLNPKVGGRFGHVDAQALLAIVA